MNWHFLIKDITSESQFYKINHIIIIIKCIKDKKHTKTNTELDMHL